MRFNKDILCIILFVFQFTGCLFAARQVSQHVRERDSRSWTAFGDMFSFEGHHPNKGPT